MKVYLYDVFHRCDSLDGWVTFSCSLTLDSTQRVEGKYSIKLTSDAGTHSSMMYERAMDWGEFDRIAFSVYHPGWTNEVGRISIITDGVNYKAWDFDFAGEWTEITIDLNSTPDDSLGTLDLSNINFVRVYDLNVEDPGEDYYFDFFRGKSIDVTDSITYIKITEEMGMPSWADLKIKGESLDHFQAGLEMEVYDKDDVLSWTGRILYPESVMEGTKVVGKLKALGSNSQFNNIYRKNFTTARSSDYMLKDFIDNALPKFTHDDEIDDFSALTFKRDLKSNFFKTSKYFRMLERAVTGYDPGGGTSFNKYNNLSKGPQIYQGTYNFEDDAVGTSGTDIGFVDGVDTAASVEIIADFNGHKKILRQAYTSAVGGNDYSHHDFPSQAKTGWWEGWFGVSDVTTRHLLVLREGTTGIVLFQITSSKFQIYDGSVPGWRDVTGAPVPISNILYHIYIQWYDAANDTFDLKINGIQYETGTQTMVNQTLGINRIYTYEYTAAKYLYLDASACSLEEDANYDVGDNLKCWDESTSKIRITSYTPVANRHVTRTPVIGANNDLGQVYYVGKSTDSIEQKYGINQLQPWKDSEITNFSEAKQLGDNLQIIYSMDTQMISMLVVGKGHLQVAKTLNLGWAGVFSITQHDFLLTKRVWYPMNDICEIELTDNVLTRKAFNVKVINKFYDEDAQQSFEEPDVSESTEAGTVLPLKSIAEIRADYNRDNMIGEDNAVLIPCAYQLSNVNPTVVKMETAYIRNIGADDCWLLFICPLPTNSGGKKLYIGDLVLDVNQADGTDDFIDQLIVNAVDYNSLYEHINDVTNRCGQGEYTYAHVGVDISAYKQAVVQVKMNGGNGRVAIASVLLECWYA